MWFRKFGQVGQLSYPRPTKDRAHHVDLQEGTRFHVDMT